MFIITVLYDRSVKLPDISFEDCENMNSQIRKDAWEGPQLLQFNTSEFIGGLYRLITEPTKQIPSY